MNPTDGVPPTLIDALTFALKRAETMQSSRELEICYTRMEEALFWAQWHICKREDEEVEHVKRDLTKFKIIPPFRPEPLNDKTQRQNKTMH